MTANSNGYGLLAKKIGHPALKLCKLNMLFACYYASAHLCHLVIQLVLLCIVLWLCVVGGLDVCK